MSDNNKKIISFIAKDTAASKKIGLLQILSLAILIILPTALLFLIGVNPNLSLLSSTRALIVLFLEAIALAFFAIHLKTGARAKIVKIICFITIVLALIFPMFEPDILSQSQSLNFWKDALRCFVVGFFSSALCAALLIYLFFKKGPIPTQPIQFSIALLASMVGITVLYFHCPDTHFSHVTAGHGSQFLAVLLITIVTIKAIFGHVMRKTLGNSSNQFNHFSEF